MKQIHLLAVCLVAALGAFAGCKTIPVAQDIKIERHSGHGLLAAKPRVERMAESLLISGLLTRGAYYSSSKTLHVDVEVFSANGTRLAFVPIAFSPNPLPHRWRSLSHAAYSEKIHGDFPAGTRVRVSVHQAPLDACRAAVFPSP